MKILAAQLNPTIGDFENNTQHILESIEKGRSQGCDLVVFPELAITGYPPEDLLLLPEFIEASDQALGQIVEASQGIALIIGTLRKDDHLYNSAAIICDGKILGYQDKQLLPTYDVFDERRYFTPGDEAKVWDIGGKRIGITICEDLWSESDRRVFTTYRCDPIENLLQKIDLMINISASPYSSQKKDARLNVLKRAAHMLKCPALLCNQIGGNDSLIFDGHSLYVDGDGKLLAQGKSFAVDHLLIDTEADLHQQPYALETTKELYQALVLGVRDYFHKSGFKRAMLGLSGGIDSAVVACIAVEALGKENLLGVSMPSRYSSEGSVDDSMILADNLEIDCLKIPIEGPFKAYEELLTPHFGRRAPDTTEENLQARIRGMILMALSNKHGYLVLSTGNKSEMALGYATLYGDMCGGLSIINDVTKLQVYEIARWINEQAPLIPPDIIAKPPSAELAPHQKDSDSLPDYKIVDAVLEDYVERHRPIEEIAATRGFDRDLVTDLVGMVHRNEYKRRQAPPGLRVTEKAFSVGRRFPIVQQFR